VKRVAILIAVVAVTCAAIYYNHRKKTDVEAGPQALANWAADVGRETSRVPMRVTRLSEAEEIRIGNDMAQQQLGSRQQQYKYSATDLAFEEYLNDVGSKLAARSKRKLIYHFYFIPDNRLFNAFALPGGHVVVGKGLVRAMDSEDQLAAVVAHEIEHVDRYHCLDRVQVEARLRHVPFGGLVALPISIFQAGYSKEQELEADREGTLLMVRSGYTAEGAVRLFEHFEKLDPRTQRQRDANPVQESARIAVGGIFDYFRSHPLPSERKRQVEELIVHEKWPLKVEKPLRLAPA
jgi:predicted Zn-dependent protease